MTAQSQSRRLRERIAQWVAPWLNVPYREDREEAFKDLAEIAYLSRDAAWTSPRTLVRVALEEAEARGRRGREPWTRTDPGGVIGDDSGVVLGPRPRAKR